jgi:hypothetical protein
MKKRIIILFFLCLSIPCLAQTGNYFLSHYTPSQEHFNNICFDMAQDTRGVMLFATNAGILEFDGKNWDIMKGPSAVYCLHINTAGEIFWGGAKGFGKVGYNDQGFHQLEVLSDSITTDIFQSLGAQGIVYFLSDDIIYMYDVAGKKISQLASSEDTGSFSRMFEMFGAVYVNTDQGVFKIENSKLIHC